MKPILIPLLFCAATGWLAGSAGAVENRARFPQSVASGAAARFYRLVE